MKESIQLRKRKTPAGNISLYLDIYRNGKREYEYLKLYLVPEVTKADRDKNKETLKYAEAIKSKRTVELMNGEFGFKSEYKTDTLFLTTIEICAKKDLVPKAVATGVTGSHACTTSASMRDVKTLPLPT